MSEHQLLAVRCALGLDKNYTMTIRYCQDEDMVRIELIKSDNGQPLVSLGMLREKWTANLLNHVNKLTFEAVTLKELCC